MPFIVQHLIQENQSIVTATEDMSVQEALEHMFEHDFSQLPVVDQDRKLRGMITNDSILRAISYCGITPDKLKVSHALFKVKPCSYEDELSELLNRLRDSSAIPIVDNDDHLTGIITSYDTTECFRQRAEDIMLAEDIEITLRDLIESAYKDGKGEIDLDKLNDAIKAITPSGQELLGRFMQALKHYLQDYTKDQQAAEQNNQGQHSNDSVQFSSQLANTAFNQHLCKPVQPKEFEALTLSEYIQLFKNLWTKYEPAFNGMAWEGLDQLLNGIRQTRNSIAHFREVTTNQREQLRFCTNLLNHHRPSIEHSETHTIEATTTVVNLHASVEAHSTASGILTVQGSGRTGAIQDLQPIDEEISPNDSRYAPLAVWLQSQVNQDSNRIQLTFRQIEDIIQGELPPSARQHRNWWANDSTSHVQSQQWLDVGWRVADVNVSEERVIFARMGERQSAYIDFFNKLLPKIQNVSWFAVEPAMNPQGRHWFTVKVTSNEIKDPTWIAFSFARKSRFRVELYIATGDDNTNKLIFDKLYGQKVEIESKFGEALSWERLNDKRASRIAAYRENSSITDSSEDLATLQEWAVQAMDRFYRAIAPKFQDVMHTLLEES